MRYTPPDARLSLAIAQETDNAQSADTRTVWQYRVSMGHRGKGQNRKKMVGRAFNVDTGQVTSLTTRCRYIRYPAETSGITHYTTWFNGDGFLNGFRVFQRLTKGSDTHMGIARRDDGGYIVYIKIGKEPITESM